MLRNKRCGWALVLGLWTSGVGMAQGTWENLGGGLAGVSGVPQLDGTGTLVPGDPAFLTLTQAKSMSTAILFVSDVSDPLPFFGGSLVAYPALLMVPLVTDAAGSIALVAPWPAGLTGKTFYFQYVVPDDAAPMDVALSQTVKAVTLPEGLEAWWPGELTDGFFLGQPVHPDDAPHGMAELPHDAAAKSIVSIVPDGKIGKALYFSAISDGQNTPYLFLLNIDGLAGEACSRTVAFWVKVPTDASDNAALAFHMGGQTAQPNDNFDVFVVSNLWFSANDTVLKTMKNIKDGAWHHVAVTYSNADCMGSAGMLKMYCDGDSQQLYTPDWVPVGDVPNGANVVLHTAGHDATIGGTSQGSNLKGYLDEMTFYNRALSAAEVDALSKANP